MSTTIVVLMILLITQQVISLGLNAKMIGKKNEISHYEEKLKKAKESTSSDGVSSLAFFIVLSIRVAIVWYAIQVIFSFVK